MKASLSLVAALASSASLAANVGRWEKETKKGGYGHVTTTEVYVTYTTYCPVTETHYEGGKTYYSTYTTTSTVETKIPTTYTVTEYAPATTETAKELVYTTLTELCPVTETKVIEGSTVEVVWTSTSTIYTKVPKTEIVYTTEVATEYESTNVYETVTYPETVYTTVVAGETVYVTKTNTYTTIVTDVKTITTVIPQTVTKEYAVTIPVTKGQTAVQTIYSTDVVSVPETFYSETSLAPSTTVIPVQSSNPPTPVETTSVVPAGASSMGPVNPLVAFVAGLLGAVALL